MLRQSKASSSHPPTIGPSAIAAPVVAPHRPIASARSCRSVKTCVSSDSVAGNTIAAPTPMTARAAISWPGLPVNPPARLARPKTARPTSSMPLRPNLSERLPKASTDAANSRLNASTTHCSWALEASSSRTRVGSATLTIVVSRLIANAASSSETRAIGLRTWTAPPELTCVMKGNLGAHLAFVKQVGYALARAPARLSRPGLLDRPSVGSHRRALDAADPPRRRARPDAVRGVPREPRDRLEHAHQPPQAALRRGGTRTRSRPAATGATEVRPHGEGTRTRPSPHRPDEVGRPLLPDAQRPPEAHPSRGLRRQRRPGSPLRPLRPARRTSRDRPPARTRRATNHLTAPSSERALSEAVGELERQRELQAAVGDRMAEQLLGAGDALQDRVAVRVETLGGAWRALALAQIDAQRLAQARGRGITPGEGPERRAHEVGHAARVLRHERRDLDVAVRRQPLAPACAGDEALGGDRAVVAAAKARQARARRAHGGAEGRIAALHSRAQVREVGPPRRADPRPDGG